MTTVPPALPAQRAAPGTTAPGLTEFWREYLRWNDSVVEEFLSGIDRGRPVYLDLDQQTLVTIARRVGVGPADPQREFFRVIRSTLNVPPEEGRVFQRHREMLELWSQGSQDRPPWCTALLAFLSFVAGGMVHDERFSSGNYYGRLCDALEIVEPMHRQKVQRDFSKDTHILWDALNNWLAATEHAFGRPSAYAFDRRAHVGIAISQALVRAQDRRRLRTLFVDWGLSPGQRLSLKGMVRLLQDWIPRSSVTPALKRLWQGPDTQEAIASIVQLELEAWDGGEERDAGTGAELDLLLTAALRVHPSPRIDFALFVRRREGTPQGPYQLVAEASPSAKAALGACGGALLLRESGVEGWLVAEDTSRMSVPDALQAQLELRCDGNREWRLARVTRRIVPLRFDEVAQLYIETQRAALGVTHLVLAHQSLANEVAEYLEQIASAGFQRARTDRLRGLPNEWVAFWPVVVVRKADIVPKELSSVLAPLTEAQVAVEGGLALPGHLTWHSACPPRIRSVALERDSVRITLVTTQTLDGPVEERGARALTTFVGEDVTDLSAFGLSDGDYQLLLEQGGNREEGEVLVSTSLRLRSADHPRPLFGPQAMQLQHEFADPGWAAVSATGHQAGETGRLVVAGAVVTPPVAVASAVGDEAGVPGRPLAQGLSDVSMEDIEPEPSTQAQTETPSCIFGYHVFVISRRRGVYTGKCRHCHIEKEYARTRAARLERAQRAIDELRPPSATGERLSRPLVPVQPSRPTQLGFAELLDALSYARGGTWESFGGLARQIDDSPWFALEMARLLAALGHVDLSLDRNTWRLEAWAIAPMAIAIGVAGEAFLCGARSQQLLRRLAEDTTSIGGTIETRRGTAGVIVVKVCGLDREALGAVAESVKDHVGQPISVVDHVPQQLLSILPNVAEVGTTLPVVTWPSLPAELYDFDTGSWRPVAEPDSPGAYRFRTRPWIYAHVSADDVQGRRARVGDSRIVKYLAAGASRRSLVGYDRERQLLITPWGAQLPGLYERVAVLCSGEPPLKMSDGTVAYQSVPSAIATALWRKLTGR